eukprot:TRINITY_DN1713_c0_g2_i1.p1 TRINITY_DN1713_c0_g2~~TRINITY_DN1713_c0_g2_i1.p1  ORF type:complete len:251 (-),score=19.00 TRINITY_DN1713_c0_g2_i1:556-1308(-)
MVGNRLEIQAPSLRGVRILNAACTPYYGSAAYILQGSDNFAYIAYPINFVSTYPYWQYDAAQIGSVGGQLYQYPLRKVVAGGGAFGMIFEIGRMQLWGQNNDNKLGHNRAAEEPYPIEFVNVTSAGAQVQFSDASIGERHSLLCSSNGIVYGSGYGVGGLLFTGDDTSSSSYIPWAYSAYYRCLRVFTTRNNSFVLNGDGTLLGVGDMSSGQLGFRADGSSLSPYQILGLPNRVVDFAVGQSGDGVNAIA